METALQSFFVSVPQAVALWLVMLLGIAAAAAAMALPRRAAGPTAAEETAAEQERWAAATAAADRAAAVAASRRAEWLAAQDQAAEAWQAFDAAERAAREAAKAAAYPLLSRRRKPGENADRQRYLHHAAAGACRRREISIGQLNEVFAHRGWNPRLHPVLQEGVLRGAVREHLRAGYRAAVEREQAAWQAAEDAADELRALRLAAEATIAGTGRPVAEQPRESAQWTTAELPVAA